jgi:hypothetical protein
MPRPGRFRAIEQRTIEFMLYFSLPSALELIEQALAGRGKDSRGPLLPSSRLAGKPISANAITHAFLRVCKAFGLNDASPHDLRRTGATALTSERIGVQRFIVSRVLNHASDRGDAAAVTAVYDRHGLHVACGKISKPPRNRPPPDKSGSRLGRLEQAAESLGDTDHHLQRIAIKGRL